MTKKKSRPALTNYRRKIREMTDFDYVARLSDSEADWLEKFAREFYAAKFSPTDNLHDTPEAKRKCYNANNARERDVWNKFDRDPGDCEAMAKKPEDDEDKNG